MLIHVDTPEDRVAFVQSGATSWSAHKAPTTYQLLSLLERSRILTGEIQREIWTSPYLLQNIAYPMRHRNWMDLSQR